MSTDFFLGSLLHILQPSESILIDLNFFFYLKSGAARVVAFQFDPVGVGFI